MKNLGWWIAGGLVALGFGVNAKKRLDAQARLGDVAIVPIGKVSPAALGAPPGQLTLSPVEIASKVAEITTPLADGTVQVNVLSSPDNTGRIQASMRNVLGVTLPVLVNQADILRLTRDNVEVA